MEIFGGNGFTEDFPLARMFRHSPLNSIWEGSGNVICLDILRAAAELPHFISYCSDGVVGYHSNLDQLLVELSSEISSFNTLSMNELQLKARWIADRLAIGK